MACAAVALVSCADDTHYEASIAPYKDACQCAISFTYDDGMLCHYTDVAPELEKRGFRGTFWIIGVNMDTVSPDYPWMTWQQVAELAQRGHEISNHTWTHPNLTTLDADAIRQELQHCDSVIEAVTGQRPLSMAYPYNAMSPEVIAICEQGRIATRTFQTGHGEVESHTTPDSLTAWLHGLIADGAWGVTMTHGTTYGWDKWLHPEWLWAFYDQVKALQDTVWVGTFAQVAAYTQEAAVAQLQCAAQDKRIDVTLTCDLDTQLYHQPLTIMIRGGHWDARHAVAEQNGNACPVTARDSLLLVDVVPNDGVAHITW